ncbi:hypothetical protein [Rugamonas aquatica]|uniref:Uncharacterized protein n=1 Tax=Rugamonas aquatica TaxID=2743357 RepID=A0A6A7N6Z5_9BURK|nr:hypothetical protein [Rugamonas aquatica]MQA40711.1 hypothetical protein [Rugamonas aquatica]
MKKMKTVKYTLLLLTALLTLGMQHLASANEDLATNSATLQATANTMVFVSKPKVPRGYDDPRCWFVSVYYCTHSG